MRLDPAADAALDGDAAAGPVAFAHARADVYDLFAAVFDGDVDAFREAHADGVFARLAATLPGQVDCDPLDSLEGDEAFAFAYDNLFVVPGERYVPPFASAHATEPAEVFDSPSAYHDAGTAGEFLGRPAATVSALYDRTGFEPTRGDGIPDHVAAVFEFQAVLCRHEAERRDDGTDVSAGRDLQRSVVEALSWLDAFDEAVRERDAAVGAFAALSSLARTFVAWDARHALADADDGPEATTDDGPEATTDDETNRAETTAATDLDADQ